MSHIVSIRTQVRDPHALSAACHRLELPAPVHRTICLFSAEATGLAVELPGWRYPVVCQTEFDPDAENDLDGMIGSNIRHRLMAREMIASQITHEQFVAVVKTTSVTWKSSRGSVPIRRGELPIQDDDFKTCALCFGDNRVLDLYDE